MSGGLARVTAGAALLGLVWAGMAWAQSVEATLGLPAEVEVRGKGWGQLGNLTEMSEFLFALIETSILTAICAFHPVTLRQRQSATDFQYASVLFVSAITGMFVGFLVVHHGYLIGFVIFGLGGLFRFRLAGSTAMENALLIVVTLIGLAVGLDVPVMAAVAALSTWVIMLVFGRRQFINMEVRVAASEDKRFPAEDLVEYLRERHFETVSLSKSDFKSTVQMVVSTPIARARAELMREMFALPESIAEHVSDWHIE